MLEDHFIRPTTVDRIRASWLAGAIEQYVAWLEEQGFSGGVAHRVPLLLRFGEFARAQGARALSELPSHVEAFVEYWIERPGNSRTPARRRRFSNEVRGPIMQLLTVVLPDFTWAGRSRERPFPFQSVAPHFFAYLVEERGLRPQTVTGYRIHLCTFESYLKQLGLGDISALNPAVLSAFVIDCAPRMAPVSLGGICGCLRVFLRYLRREGKVSTDLASSVEAPQVYRLATLPRSISWEDVRRVLASVDRRSAVGRRDYAILLLLVTYGLRAREVVALTLDDIDWKAERLRIPERKAGHSTAFPLSSVVGEALLYYLREGRPDTTDRHVFFRAAAPRAPITSAAVSSCAARYLRLAAVNVLRPGAHTLRHTCVQRLVDEDFDFKTIGDYVGHRAAVSTGIYGKVAVEALRHVALGAEEGVLQ